MSVMTKRIFVLTVITGFIVWPTGCGRSEEDSRATQSPAAPPPVIEQDGVDEPRGVPTDGQTEDDDTYVM